MTICFIQNIKLNIYNYELGFNFGDKINCKKNLINGLDWVIFFYRMESKLFFFLKLFIGKISVICTYLSDINITTPKGWTSINELVRFGKSLVKQFNSHTDFRNDHALVSTLHDGPCFGCLTAYLITSMCQFTTAWQRQLCGWARDFCSPIRRCVCVNFQKKIMVYGNTT